MTTSRHFFLSDFSVTVSESMYVAQGTLLATLYDVNWDNGPPMFSDCCPKGQC